MATNGSQESFAPSDVLAAVMTMRTGEQDNKTKAHHYLERFQKSVRASKTSLSPTHAHTFSAEGLVRFFSK